YAVNEGRPDHGAEYLVASVDAAPGVGYDFDRVMGAPGCTAADVPARPVGGLRLPGRTLPCSGTTSPTTVAWGTNAVDCHYFDIDVAFDDPAPPWYAEGGEDAPPALLAGYEVMYVT